MVRLHLVLNSHTTLDCTNINTSEVHIVSVYALPQNIAIMGETSNKNFNYSLAYYKDISEIIAL